MQGDVIGVSCPAGAATTVYDGRTRIKGLAISALTANATVAVANGATTLFTYTATGTGPIYINIPGEGVVCEDSLVVTCAAGISAVAFYG
jgi:hypothetical protein